MPGLYVKFEILPDEFLSHLTEAAYRVALRQGLKGSFLDFELCLRKEICDVIQRDMLVSDLCGLYTICEEAMKCQPWSREAENIYHGER
ncbi:MAG: hypothetical protein HY539_01165 [Deltaproteobacteria bacterium]|nr:hypothetical protein [Deltaproteobacteria bacterium]MBI4196411.1 hypothetical protein [Deltaproteobacteria bacterium]